MTSATWTDPLLPLTALVGAASEIGNYREANEDLFVLDPEHPFALVLDGMGGQELGAEAARVGAEVVGRILTDGFTSGEESAALLTRAIRDGHAAILDLQKAPDCRGCAATIVAALLYDGLVFVTWAGDSMAYRVTGEKVERLTWPHDNRNYLIRLYGPGAADGFIKNALAHYLGGTLPDPIEVPSFEPQPGDRLILTTDGVSHIVELPAVAAACREHPDPLACAEHLVQLALDHGARHDATAVVVAFGDVPPPTNPPPRPWWRFW